MKTRNRLDHHVPRCYLEGFTNPSATGQLSVFNRQDARWFETGTAGVGAIKGFYDYSGNLQPDQTADQAFSELETRFPAVRRALVAKGFSNWKKELSLLLRFAQMLRARSLLFREQSMGQNRQSTFLKIDKILPPEPSKIAPGKFVTAVEYSPYVPTEPELHDKTITDMQTEISNGATWMSQMEWCLRVTQNPADPFVTCDVPIVMEGTTPKPDDALQDGRTLVFFPLCWQACLAGSPAKFDSEIDVLGPDDMRKLRRLYLKSANRFVFSPVRTDF